MTTNPNNLRQIRKQLNLTQAKLAAAVGCTQSNIGHIEMQRQQIKSELANRIVNLARSRGLDVNVDYLYGGSSAGIEPVMQKRKPNIQLLGDAFGGNHIVVDGRVFITINYIAQYIDNSGMRTLSNKILELINGEKNAN